MLGDRQQKLEPQVVKTPGAIGGVDGLILQAHYTSLVDLCQLRGPAGKGDLAMTALDSITIDIECPNCDKHIQKTVSSPKPATKLRSSRGMKIDPRFLQTRAS